jgi:hypothetical protein
MGEMADDAIDRMLDDLFEGRGAYTSIPRYGRDSYRPKKKKVKEYPAETFDMSSFPAFKPKPPPEPEVSPNSIEKLLGEEDSPF